MESFEEKRILGEASSRNRPYPAEVRSFSLSSSGFSSSGQLSSCQEHLFPVILSSFGVLFFMIGFRRAHFHLAIGNHRA